MQLVCLIYFIYLKIHSWFILMTSIDKKIQTDYNMMDKNGKYFFI